MGVVRNITKTRIYRTVSGENGDTQYFFVAEQDVTLDVYIDVKNDVEVANGSELASVNWFAPPEGLMGWIAMPNGMIVAFKENELWFCEPYRPHAWPRAYVLVTEFPIVGIGVSGISVVAATEGYPVMANGINPSSMAVEKVKLPEPCLSRGSVLGTGAGVFYVSKNGLVFVAQSGSGANSTESWITRERWAELTPSKNIRAVKMSSSYFAFGTVVDGDTSVAQDGFTVEMALDNNSFGALPQPGGHRVGFGKLSAPGDLDITNLMVDPWSGVVLLIQDGSMYYYDYSDQAPEIIPFVWRSKLLQQRSKKNFEVMKMWFSVPPGTPTLSPTRDTSSPQPTLGPNQYAIIRVYAGDQPKNLALVTTREVRKSGELLRILSGFKYEYWQWEMEGRIEIDNLQCATSVTELRGV